MTKEELLEYYDVLQETRAALDAWSNDERRGPATQNVLDRAERELTLIKEMLK